MGSLTVRLTSCRYVALRNSSWYVKRADKSVSAVNARAAQYCSTAEGEPCVEVTPLGFRRTAAVDVIEEGCEDCLIWDEETDENCDLGEFIARGRPQCYRSNTPEALPVGFSNLFQRHDCVNVVGS
jgi:hypothetical protein